ncbi:MAG: hypothetical protein ACI9V8_001198 [Urechidicola sp.]|jgi:hypothetical protein
MERFQEASVSIMVIIKISQDGISRLRKASVMVKYAELILTINVGLRQKRASDIIMSCGES